MSIDYEKDLVFRRETLIEEATALSAAIFKFKLWNNNTPDTETEDELEQLKKQIAEFTRNLYLCDTEEDLKQMSDKLDEYEADFERITNALNNG